MKKVIFLSMFLLAVGCKAMHFQGERAAGSQNYYFNTYFTPADFRENLNKIISPFDAVAKCRRKFTLEERNKWNQLSEAYVIRILLPHIKAQPSSEEFEKNTDRAKNWNSNEGVIRCVDELTMEFIDKH